jgi:hypothetical protein
MATGYLHRSYAGSFLEFGTPRQLPRCGGWILEREIPGTTHRDAMGCYPIFVCDDWSRLSADLEDIGQELVSVSIVTDPFGDYDATCLKKAFKDIVVPFKEHIVVDLSYPLSDAVSRHHRYYSRKSLKKVRIEVCQDPIRFFEDWIGLYDTLVKRRHIRGLSAFSYSSFAKQFSVPGLFMLRVVYENLTIGAQLWFIQKDVGYSHLTAFNEVAYKLRASYGLYWTALEYFSKRLRWLDLGGGAGLNKDGCDGLTAFKRGWSSGTRPAYFCGRIFNKRKYEEIVQLKNVITHDYFPAYRNGEFT